ncbi:MAG: peptide deformylase [Planctomycetaceae bacterium]|nr:MAG: peptide deformylase [Planctomycetaceae bacterium]
MAVKEILLLGNPALYERSVEVAEEDRADLGALIEDLHDTLLDFRGRYGAGRAIAAPQIGVRKRLIYLHLVEPMVFVNPVLTPDGPEMMELWDDCMSFPDLLVRVRRYKRCRLTFSDAAWRQRQIGLEGDLSELLQHEYDHLDGILAVSRAIEPRSFALRSQRGWLA